MNDNEPQSPYCGPFQDLVADPVVEARVELLEGALHGGIEDQADLEYNWSGVDETNKLFVSLAKKLDESVPPPRPTSDLPEGYGPTKQGS